MQQAVVIRVFVASPTDMKVERDAAVRVITEWNAAHSLDRGAIIEAVRMESHAQAALGNHPQEIINSELLGRCDLLLGMFYSKLGTPTDHEKSGTVQEINEFIEMKGPDKVLLFFSQRNYPNDINTTDLNRLRKFKDDMKSQGLYIGFEDSAGFESVFRHQLEMRMNKILNSDEFAQMRYTNTEVSFVDDSEVDLSDSNNVVTYHGNSKDNLRSELFSLGSTCRTRLDEEYNLNREHIAPAQKFLKRIRRKFFDYGIQYGSVMSENERTEFYELIFDIGELLKVEPELRPEWFWSKSEEVTRSINDFANLL